MARLGRAQPHLRVLLSRRPPVAGGVVDTPIAIPSGAVTATGQLPIALRGGICTPAQAQITATGQLPIGLRGTIISPAQGAITTVGQAPVALLGAIATPGVGAIVVTGQLPVALRGTISTPAQGTITATGQLPIGLRGTIFTPAQGVVTATGQTPITLRGTIATPGTGAITTTGLQSIALRGDILTPATGAATLTGPPPTAFVETFKAPEQGAITLTGQTPTVSVGASTVITLPFPRRAIATDGFDRADEDPLASPWAKDTTHFGYLKLASNRVRTSSASAGDSVMYYTGPTWPDNQYAKAVYKASGIARDSGPAVRVQEGGNAYIASNFDSDLIIGRFIAGSYETVASTSYTLAVNDELTLRAETFPTYVFLEVLVNGVSVYEGYDFEANRILSGSPGFISYEPDNEWDDWEAGFPETVSLNGLTPTISIGSGTSDTAISPDTGQIVATGQTPIALRGEIKAPAQGAATITGHLPVGLLGVIFTPGVGSVAASGQAPAVGLGATPQPGSVVASGVQPVALLGVVSTPASASITASGAAPSWALGVIETQGEVVLSGQAPTSSQGLVLSPDTGSVTASGLAPLNDLGVVESTGGVVLSGLQPIALQGVVSTPDQGLITFTGQTPVVVIDSFVQPANGSVVVVGLTPLSIFGEVTICYPIGDSSSTPGWGAVPAEPFYECVDEATPDLGDYIFSPPLSVTAETNTMDWESFPSGTHYINVIARASSGSGTLTIVALDNVGSVIGTSAGQGVTGTPTAYTLPITTTGTTVKMRIEVTV